VIFFRFPADQINFFMKEIVALQQEHVQPCRRRQDTNFIYKWSYMYLNDLIARGVKGDLQPDDYALIEDGDECQQLAKSILEEYGAEQKKGKPSLWRVLFKVFGFQYSVGGAVYLTEALVQLTQGFFLSKLLSWFQTPEADIASGYYYCIALAVGTIVHGICHHVEFFIAYRTGMRTKVGLIASIYRKSLSLSISNTSSTGFIVNLVSNDVQRFEDVAPFAHFIWIVPIQIALTMWLIYLEIGYLFVAPMIGLLLLIPLQGIFAKRFGSLRKIVVNFRDDRIKNISDMLAGILVVKLYAWELPFMEKIREYRNSEIELIWKANVLKAINESIFFSSGGLLC
jgi:ATP-binding cassette, subfamily C (CFTR/MRP), member 4